MQAQDIILRPVITEQSMADMELDKYTFEVDTRATKSQVKRAVKELFDVDVEKVNIMNTKPKPKRICCYVGYTKKKRKAIVTLKPDSKEIEIFQTEE